MTETLTNEEICELMEWKADTRYEENYWIMPDGDTTDTPAFDKLEQPWFDYVVPWLSMKRQNATIRLGRNTDVIVEIYDGVLSKIYGVDRQSHIAFNKALYQLREQL